jgi:hypothetical protein
VIVCCPDLHNLAADYGTSAYHQPCNSTTNNLFNRVNYTAPDGNRSQAAFGTITSTYDPRQMQLGVKVLW